MQRTQSTLRCTSLLEQTFFKTMLRLQSDIQCHPRAVKVSHSKHLTDPYVSTGNFTTTQGDLRIQAEDSCTYTQIALTTSPLGNLNRSKGLMMHARATPHCDQTVSYVRTYNIPQYSQSLLYVTAHAHMHRSDTHAHASQSHNQRNSQAQGI